MEDALERVAKAFNASDGAQRLELLVSCLSEDAEIVHVHGESHGPHAFAEVMTAIQRDFGPLVVGLGAQRALGRWLQCPWTLATPNSVFARGAYVARVGDDGRITHLLSLPDESGTG